MVASAQNTQPQRHGVRPGERASRSFYAGERGLYLEQVRGVINYALILHINQTYIEHIMSGAS